MKRVPRIRPVTALCCMCPTKDIILICEDCERAMAEELGLSGRPGPVHNRALLAACVDRMLHHFDQQRQRDADLDNLEQGAGI